MGAKKSGKGKDEKGPRRKASKNAIKVPKEEKREPAPTPKKVVVKEEKHDTDEMSDSSKDAPAAGGGGGGGGGGAKEKGGTGPPGGEDAAWNELADVEAELPLEKGLEVIIRESHVMTVKGKKFKFLESADSDFGTVKVLQLPVDGGAGKTERVSMTFELTTAKIRRLRVQATISALAAANSNHKTHFMRLMCIGHAGPFKFLITPPYGHNLMDLLVLQGRSFSPGCSVKLALHTFEALEELHSMGYVCRDVKPQAFIASKKGRIYFVHMGLGRRFKIDNEMAKTRPKVPFFGNIRYAPRRAHEELERGRADDLESWIYMVSEFFGDRALYWRSLSNKAEVLLMKRGFLTHEGFTELRERLRKIPELFGKMYECVYSIKPEEEPEYLRVKDYLTACITAGNWGNLPFDWDSALAYVPHKPKDDYKDAPEDAKDVVP